METIRQWMEVVASNLFFCRHKRRPSQVFSDPETKRQYQVCLDCGTELEPKVTFPRSGVEYVA